MKKYIGHTQEVCGLRWSCDHQLLASGGNDNKVSIALISWNLCMKLLFLVDHCLKIVVVVVVVFSKINSRLIPRLY